MAERSYLSIGEVLSLLQEEFPDVTISKIRFLESQGLIDPERTPSGYRKFYDADVERLRFILREQREHYLPLKVIKDRLEGIEDDEGGPSPAPSPSEPALAAVPVAVGGGSEVGRPADAAGAAEGAPPQEPPAAGPEVGPVPAATGRRPSTPPAPEPAAGERLPAWMTAPRPTPPPASPAPLRVVTAGTGMSLTLDELAQASGLPHTELRTLEGFGLIHGRSVGRETLYDEEALEVASLAAGFHRFGVEARHLRMYLTSAEREASVFEQVALPLIKQRNPRARVQARETVHELMRLGDALRDAMLRRAVRSFTEPR